MTTCNWSILLRAVRRIGSRKSPISPTVSSRWPGAERSGHRSEQLNRELSGKNRNPRLSDLREGGAIEHDAEVVGLLDKPGSDDQDAGSTASEEGAVPVNLLIAKQRNRPTGDASLTFLKPYTRFESAAQVSDEDVAS